MLIGVGVDFAVVLGLEVAARPGRVGEPRVEEILLGEAVDVAFLHVVDEFVQRVGRECNYQRLKGLGQLKEPKLACASGFTFVKTDNWVRIVSILNQTPIPFARAITIRLFKAAISKLSWFFLVQLKPPPRLAQEPLRVNSNREQIEDESEEWTEGKRGHEQDHESELQG